MANRFLSNIKINDAYTFPASDGSNGQAITTDGSGNLSFTDISVEAGSTVIYQDNFTGDNSTTQFTLAHAVTNEVLTQIYIDGVYQNKDTYSVLTDTITFSEAPFTGADIEVITIATAAAALGDSTVNYYVKNTTGSTINRGTAVMATGTDGNSGHILVAPMVADGTVEPKYYIGVLADDIANGDFGYAIHFGSVIKVNTNAFNDGDVLWVDPSTPGGFTANEPNAPSVKLATAIVLNSATNGKIFVRVQGNEGLHELHDVNISSVAEGELLTWDSTNSYWRNTNTVTAPYIRFAGDVDVDGDVNIDGGDITSNSTGFNLLNSNVVTVNAFGAASQINMGVGSGELYMSGSIRATSVIESESSIKVADDTTTASSSNVGSLRYREDVNGSYVDMCMKTSSTPTYAWVNIVQNTF